jgi:penicillin-binding protein 2
MSALRQIKNPQYEASVFSSRIFISVIIVIVSLCILLSRFFYLQVIQHETLLKNSEKNRIKTKAIAPARGLIYDRNGKLLVNNIPTYRLNVTPEKVADLSSSLKEIQSLIQLSDEEVSEFLNNIKNNQAFNSIPLKNKLTEKELSKFIVNKHKFIGFEAQPYLIRQYLYTNILSHVIGYVGRINTEDLGVLDKQKYIGSEYTGKLGVEKYYENTLHGSPGSIKVETNVKGRILNTIEEKTPQSGQDIYLTLDIELQKVAYDALGDLTGSVIAINPNNGEILAMVSKPGFDPNDFVNGISQAKYSALINSSEKPLFNRSIKGRYEPGSTIKPYIALAALDGNTIDLNYRMFSKGFFQLPKQERKYHDWKKGGHGTVDIIQSLAQSVNTFYYDLAVKLGIDRIYQFLDLFKFGQPTNIDLLGEKTGILPSRAWKKAIKNTIWYPGETVITGIGQGYLSATPIQLAYSLTILASRGKINTPHLLKKSTNTESQESLSIKDSYWDIVHKGMIAVIHDSKGTASVIKNSQFLTAGKSGTSQVYGKNEEDVYLKNEEIPKHLRNHALFIAFAPAENPEIAIVVVAEHGASGSKVAAPIAGDVIKAYMMRRN